MTVSEPLDLDALEHGKCDHGPGKWVRMHDWCGHRDCRLRRWLIAELRAAEARIAAALAVCDLYDGLAPSRRTDDVRRALTGDAVEGCTCPWPCRHHWGES
jgi:hypothetical protein